MIKHLLISAACVAAMWTPVAAQEPTVIKFGFSSVVDLENDNGAAALLFKDYVESHSDTLEVEIYGSSELGADQDVIQALQLGSGATMHIGGTATYNTFVERVGVFDLPFLWADYAHAGRALDGEAGDAIRADFEQTGFKVLG